VAGTWCAPCLPCNSHRRAMALPAPASSATRLPQGTPRLALPSTPRRHCAVGPGPNAQGLPGPPQAQPAGAGAAAAAGEPGTKPSASAKASRCTSAPQCRSAGPWCRPCSCNWPGAPHCPLPERTRTWGPVPAAPRRRLGPASPAVHLWASANPSWTTTASSSSSLSSFSSHPGAPRVYRVPEGRLGCLRCAGRGKGESERAEAPLPAPPLCRCRCCCRGRAPCITPGGRLKLTQVRRSGEDDGCDSSGRAALSPLPLLPAYACSLPPGVPALCWAMQSCP